MITYFALEFMSVLAVLALSGEVVRRPSGAISGLVRDCTNGESLSSVNVFVQATGQALFGNY